MTARELKSYPFKPFLIGIAGGTGSGKSCLTQQIVSSFPEGAISRIDCDSYYRDISHLPFSVRLSTNFDDPSALDLDLLLRHLQSLLNGRQIRKPRYDFATHLRSAEDDLIVPSPVLLLEGIFALCDERIRSLLKFKVYVDCDPDLRLVRRLQRDVRERGRSMESVIEQYLDSVRPMHLRHIEPTKVFADLILNNSDSLDATPVLMRIRELVAQHRSEQEMKSL
jgi:uridine kinase